MIFNLKKGDLLPLLRMQLLDPIGTPPNLSGATVVFNMGTKIVRAPVDIVDAVAGEVSYSWAPLDTNVAGEYKAEFEVTFPGGKPMTYPNSRFFNVVILEDLG